MHLWILLSTPLLAVTSELSPSASQQTDSNVHSRHFAVRTGDDGSREVVSLDSAGPAFELAGALAVFGPDDIFLVLDPEASGGLRDVRLMDASFAQVSAFEIPVDLAPLLGGQGLVLRRRSIHAAGTAFRLEFRDLEGRVQQNHQQAERVLLDIDALSDGRWAATSVDPAGEMHVHMFDTLGVLQWERNTGISASPVVANSPTGDLTAIGVLDMTGDLSTSRLDLVDNQGQTVGTTNLPAFRFARFDSQGARIALASKHTVTLVQALDGETLWSRTQRRPLMRGDSVAFSADGGTLRALAYEADQDGTPESLVLLELTDLENTPRGGLRALQDFGPPGHSVLDFTDESGAWQIVTRNGFWTLND